MYLAGFSNAWFAIQVKPRLERAVASMLQSKGYEQLLPTYQPKLARRVRPDAPLFPGYVFSRFDERVHAPIITTPGVIRIVGCGKQPVCIPEPEIEALRALSASGSNAEPYPYLRHGRTVRVTAGPLLGVVGKVAGSGEASRLVISVTLLNRSVAGEIQENWLAPFAGLNPRDRGSQEENNLSWKLPVILK
jgi:transcription antitermination factor NusG